MYVKKLYGQLAMHATRGQSENQIRYLVACGVIHPMMKMLEYNNSKMLLITMDGLNNILQCGEDIKNAENSKIKKNEFVCYVETANGLDKVKWYNIVYLQFDLILM